MTIECCDCKHRQGVNESCEKCGLRFGKVIKFNIRQLSFSSKHSIFSTSALTASSMMTKTSSSFTAQGAAYAGDQMIDIFE